jgi:DNA-binding NarL/FixJ family response regulator
MEPRSSRNLSLSIAEPSQPDGELVLNGKRYRLVPVDVQDATDPLSPRQAQIVALVARGYVNKQIAAELCVSEGTVATHVRRIFLKLRVETRAAMVLRYAQIIGDVASLYRK